jgi:hypothetical protein
LRVRGVKSVISVILGQKSQRSQKAKACHPEPGEGTKES